MSITTNAPEKTRHREDLRSATPRQLRPRLSAGLAKPLRRAAVDADTSVGALVDEAVEIYLPLRRLLTYVERAAKSDGVAVADWIACAVDKTLDEHANIGKIGPRSRGGE